MIKYSKITIVLTENRDRTELFDIVCENLHLGITAAKKAFKVKSAIPSFDSLFKLLIKHEVNFTFIGEGKKLVVICPVLPEVPLTGTQMMQQPQTIEETEVDKVNEPPVAVEKEEKEEEEEVSFIDPNEGEKEEVKSFDTPDEDDFDDDELPF
jgi:hypothetical protein